MKKIIPIVVIALLAVFVGGPYYSGKVAESETRKMIANLNASSTEYGSTEILSYERGARSTSAKYSYTLPATLAGLIDRTDPIEYSCDSAHGITGIDYTCKFDGDSDYSKFVTEKLGGTDPLSIYGSVSAFGGFTQTIALSEIKDLEVDGETINIPNMNIEVATDADMGQFDVSGGSDPFSMDADGGKLSLGKMTLGGDLNRLEGNLMTGDFKIDLASFDLQGPQGNSSLKNLSVTTETKENGENLDSAVNFAVDEMTVPGEMLKTIEDVTFNLTANGVDTQAMVEYQEFATQMQRDVLASLESGEQQETDPMQMAALMPILERMLKQGLHIKTDLNAKLNGEPNTFDLDLKLLESMTIAQLPAFMTQPDEALKKVDVSFGVALDKKLIDSQPMVSGMVAQSPLVDAASDDYKISLKLGEKIELNGKAMSFQELQMLVLSNLPM